MRQTESVRYDAVMNDLQMIGQRNMLCGLHVHVELPDPDERVDVMTRMLPGTMPAWMLRPGPWPTLISARGRSTRRVNRRRTSAFHSPPPERILPPDLAPTAQASLTTSWGDEQAA
jgi:hypothetical protein